MRPQALRASRAHLEPPTSSISARRVDLQRLADRGRDLVADPVVLRLRSQESERIVECWSRKGQEVVSGSREKASVYLRLVSAPLNFRASPIAIAPWSPILL
eukprot:4657703-Prymnesium_polylepis.1